jgi:lysylphosphatidylglycerol synthetase-like protein (DUF2156 family)
MNINAGRIIAVGFAMCLSFCALLFGLFYAGIYLHEPSVQHRHLNVVIGFLPFLFTFWLVYRFNCTDELESWEILYLRDFYPKAFLRAVLAEVFVCLAVAGLVFLLELSATRQSREGPHPRPEPPPVMKD